MKTFADYQANALTFALPKCLDLVNAALGLTGEAGEFAEHVKKHLFLSKPLDREHLKKELGDILWYVACACETLGLSLEEVAEANVQKLSARWPDGPAGKEVR